MPAKEPTRITFTRPDDWHTHLRQGSVLRAVLPFTASTYARAIVMPNLLEPVTTTEKAKIYRQEILAALPKNARFTPLMTIYLTDNTDPDDIERGFKEGVVTAAKLYPAHATTNAQHGVTDLSKIKVVLERMQKIRMPLLVHGEVTDPDVDIFDREAVFLEKALEPLRRSMPELRIVLEHVTTKDAVDYVQSAGATGTLAATITAHHLVLNRTDLFNGGIRPHFYCLPIVKREHHRQALIQAATSGLPMFFLGTDSAPHSRIAKECACGSAGIFSAPNALFVYAEVFASAKALDRLESFASLNGPRFYQLPVNNEELTLERIPPNSESIKPILTEDGQQIVLFSPLSSAPWRLV